VDLNKNCCENTQGKVADDITMTSHFSG